MSVSLSELLQRHGLDSYQRVMQAAAGGPENALRDDRWFRRMVIDPAWEAAPLQMRLSGREKLGWDAALLALKPKLFYGRDGKVCLRPEWQKIWEQQLAAAPPADDDAPLKVSDTGEFEALDTPTRVVGIDLGTTFSVVACVDEAGKPRTLRNSEGDLLTPSVVYFSDEGPVVGRRAADAAATFPDKVADLAKRDMGRPVYRKPVNGEMIRPEVVSSVVLKRLRDDAERLLGPVDKAVVTVPAYFDEPRRQATAVAAQMAGIGVLDLMNEPTAAAIAYGYQQGLIDRDAKPTGAKPLQVLVFDLGGGTFDVSIVCLETNNFRVVATDGDVYLGGKDWDERLADLLAEKCLAQCGVDPRSTPRDRAALMLAAEAAKRALTEQAEAFAAVRAGSHRVDLPVSRAEFEDATAALLYRTRATAQIVAQQAELTWDDIDRVLLVGGSTRMPQVAAMLEHLTGQAPDRTLAPDEAVAHGAALYADLLLRRTGQGGGSAGGADFNVANVNSHSLGIAAITPQNRKVNRILIKKNSPLPTQLRMRFRTHLDNQRTISIRVLEGENDDVDACSSVGEAVVRDLPQGLPAGTPVEVQYRYSADGRLEVRAEVVGHGAAIVTDFVRDHSLPDGDLLLWAELLRRK